MVLRFRRTDNTPLGWPVCSNAGGPFYAESPLRLLSRNIIYVVKFRPKIERKQIITKNCNYPLIMFSLKKPWNFVLFNALVIGSAKLSSVWIFRTQTTPAAMCSLQKW